MIKHFDKGSGCYTCEECGKLTRNTQGEGEQKVCARCYQAQEWANSISDGDYTLDDVPESERELVAKYL